MVLVCTLQGLLLRRLCRSLSFWHRGLPIINPYAKAYAWWCAFVLFMDATYTAFVVPIGVGFNTSGIQWNWVGYWDFIAGELLLHADAAVTFPFMNPW